MLEIRDLAFVVHDVIVAQLPGRSDLLGRQVCVALLVVSSLSLGPDLFRELRKVLPGDLGLAVSALPPGVAVAERELGEPFFLGRDEEASRELLLGMPPLPMEGFYLKNLAALIAAALLIHLPFTVLCGGKPQQM